MESFYQDLHNTLYNIDFRKNNLPDESAQMVVTSPPYWGLRKYSGEQELIWGDKDCEHQWDSYEATLLHENRQGLDGSSIGNTERRQGKHGYEVGQASFCQLCGAWKGAYGLEPTPEMYIEHTVEILREIRRVLRKDGVVFWNIGDCYSATRWSDARGTGAWSGDRKKESNPVIERGGCNLPAKNLCLIPFRVALAAQEAGWWVRSVIIWSKPNPMPESVTDRPTESHEYILMLTKSARYYWDQDAVREPHSEWSQKLQEYQKQGSYHFSSPKHKNTEGGAQWIANVDLALNPAGRNIRSVWEFNEDDEQGDKVYKVLEGCPIHSPLLHPEILKTLYDGEPVYRLLSHSLDMYNRLVLVPAFSLTSKLYHTNGGVHLSNLGFHHHETECGQIAESIGDNKMLSLCCPDGGHKYGHQKVDHTKHIQKADGSLFCSSDYSRQTDELTATLRNKEIRRTVSLIVESDSVSLKIPYRTARILRSLGCICSYNYYTTSHFPLQDVWNFSTQPYKAAHFAVFPEKLPEICIKAATPEVGCCSKCGAPWERITKQQIPEGGGKLKYDSKFSEDATGLTPQGFHRTASIENERSASRQEATEKFPSDPVAQQKYINQIHDHGGIRRLETLGWQPTCKCNADKVPSIVLDPFAGAGTTLWVAKKLNRQAIGYEISQEYCQLAVERNRQQVLI